MKLKLILSSRDSIGKTLEIKRLPSYHKLKTKKIAQDLMILKKKSLFTHKKIVRLLMVQLLRKTKREKISTSLVTPIKRKLKIKKRNWCKRLKVF